VPVQDHYFFGRLDLNSEVGRRDFLSNGSLQSKLLGGVTNLLKMSYKPTGFSWMVFVDRDDFDRNHYSFSYARREYPGDVRCIVFDVTPKKGAGNGRFQGPHLGGGPGHNIVRVNGTYIHAPATPTSFTWIAGA